MPCCGKRGFATSPARWARISTLTSFVSCAIARARSFSPSMSMPTVAANKPHSSSHSVSARKASPLAVCSCPKATIQTPSSSTVVTHDSSKLFSGLPSREVPPDPAADLPYRPDSVSCRRADHRPRGWLDQSLLGSRICSSLGGYEPVHLRLQPAALCSLVGERSSHRRHSGRRPNRVHAPGLCEISV